MLNDHPHPILVKIDAFRAKNDLSKSAFGSMAMGDPKFVYDLEAGREPRRKTIQKVSEFIKKPPKGVPAKKRRGAA